MTDFKAIYATQAHRYDRMVEREDQRGNLLATLLEICPLQGKIAVDMGAGTGRMTRLLALMAKRVYAFDQAPAMVEVAQQVLEESGLTNWRVGVADNRALPLPDACADVVVEGWSFAHAVGWSPDHWQAEVAKMMAEMRRILKPNGTFILLETMGTGTRQPQPPNESLARLYAWWESTYGLSYRWIRTDYQFETVQEADELTRFFFGDTLADKLVQEKATLLPECTGVWWGSV